MIRKAILLALPDVPSRTISIGLLQEHNSQEELAGEGYGTWGYRCSDGSMLAGNNIVGSGPTYGAGKRVGMEINLKRTAWYSLDGNRVGNMLEDVLGQLYPAVSI
ncbi:hypothetical protein CC78DRAFT_577276 [Lojkania enalia]|uniref:B30.2/SPRY domain-containing protein n=1 Tax=Lojkania enalia TaxID=147567 RepID=A0A9P4KDP5_9PLEO|nr:hypothetical protein CC78DRAFT_577276 [Didymosphaeria enalia]